MVIVLLEVPPGGPVLHPGWAGTGPPGLYHLLCLLASSFLYSGLRGKVTFNWCSSASGGDRLRHVRLYIQLERLNATSQDLGCRRRAPKQAPYSPSVYPRGFA